MIYAIGDLHLDYTKNKAMDIFGENWVNHEEKIFNNWKETVKEDDLVLLPGDISWALKLDEAYKDLERINELPGYKIISKGNHDYWWQGPKKLKSLGLDKITFIQNNSFVYNDKVAIFGTRGWLSRDWDGFTEKDERVFLRELNRLKLSLTSLKEDVESKIVMLHYPPFNTDSTPNEFVDLMVEHKIDICIYGHLHAEGHRFVVEKEIEGIKFHCVSCDYINFKPKRIL
ncbi:MAG: serine/threonine protein phosphatase [Tissierellia bacterium]|nr:serine/threonine protein phosphatase [Tissierellia bacterium]